MFHDQNVRKARYTRSKVYWDGGGIWSKGFFVSTVGINEEIIKRYVQMQGKEDAGQAELEF